MIRPGRSLRCDGLYKKLKRLGIATRLSGEKTCSATVMRAREDFVRRAKARQILGLRGPAFAALAIGSGCECITTDRDFARFPALRWRHPLA